MIFKKLMEQYNDEKDLQAKPQRTEEEYFKDRVKHKINIYSRKGDHYKICYWLLASISAIGAAIVPALINIDGDLAQSSATIVSIIVAIAVAFDGIFHPRHLWRNYDFVSAEIRSEEMRYSTKAPPYSESAPEENKKLFIKFVANIEDRISAERSDTIFTRTAANAEKHQSRLMEVDDDSQS